MLVFGLVHDGGWEPPEHGPGPEPREDEPPERRPWSWRLPWRPLAWFAAWCWLMALVPVVSSAAGGLAGELAAIINEEAFADLDGPIVRITALDTPVPFSPPLEHYFLPKVEDVVREAKKLHQY